MTSIAHDLFPHRVNRDGSFDSICKRCFQTIASCSNETALAAAEQEHRCDGPLLLYSLAAVRPTQFVSAHN
jgi:hypothetical protein